MLMCLTFIQEHMAYSRLPLLLICDLSLQQGKTCLLPPVPHLLTCSFPVSMYYGYGIINLYPMGKHFPNYSTVLLYNSFCF